MRCSRCYLQSSSIICGICYQDHLAHNREGRNIIIEKHQQNKNIFQEKITKFNQYIEQLATVNKKIGSHQNSKNAFRQNLYNKNVHIQNLKQNISVLKEQIMKKKYFIAQIKKQKQKLKQKNITQQKFLDQQKKKAQTNINIYKSSLNKSANHIFVEIKAFSINYDYNQWNKLKTMTEQQVMLCATIIQHGLESDFIDAMSFAKINIRSITFLSQILGIALPYILNKELIESQFFPFNYSQELGWAINTTQLIKFQVNAKYLLGRLGIILKLPYLQEQQLTYILQKYVQSLLCSFGCKINMQKILQNQQAMMVAQQEYGVQKIIADKIINFKWIQTKLTELYLYSAKQQAQIDMSFQVLNIEPLRSQSSDAFQVMELLQ